MEYISIITFFAGFIISEIIRRLNRAESFNTQIFNKRLDVFCELYSIWNSAYDNMTTFIETIANDTVPNDVNLSEHHFKIVEPLLRYIDEKALFFSEELCVQCGAAFLGFDDFTKEGCKQYLENLQQQNKIVTTMIKCESGLNMLNKNIKGIIRYKHKSAIISYYKKVSGKEKKSSSRNGEHHEA